MHAGVGAGVGEALGDGVGEGVGDGVGIAMHTVRPVAPAVQSRVAQVLQALFPAESWYFPLGQGGHNAASTANPCSMSSRYIAEIPGLASASTMRPSVPMLIVPETCPSAAVMVRTSENAGRHSAGKVAKWMSPPAKHEVVAVQCTAPR
jgi:hypothetical protein